jgi:hypothetical protein
MTMAGAKYLDDEQYMGVGANNSLTLRFMGVCVCVIILGRKIRSS